MQSLFFNQHGEDSSIHILLTGFQEFTSSWMIRGVWGLLKVTGRSSIHKFTSQLQFQTMYFFLKIVFFKSSIMTYSSPLNYHCYSSRRRNILNSALFKKKSVSIVCHHGYPKIIKSILCMYKQNGKILNKKSTRKKNSIMLLFKLSLYLQALRSYKHIVKVMSKVHKFMNPQHINWIHNFKIIMDFVKDYVREWANKKESWLAIYRYSV